MTTNEAIRQLELLKTFNVFCFQISGTATPYKECAEIAISALRAQQEAEQKLFTAHEVAEILADAIGDDCACNVNGNDEWLSEKCEFQDICPNTVGVSCWEQYLKHRRPPK